MSGILLAPVADNFAEKAVDRLWQACEPLRPDHPALKRFPVDARNCRQMGDLLALPLSDEFGTLGALAFAEPNGEVMTVPLRPYPGLALKLGPRKPGFITYADLETACMLHIHSGETLIWCPDGEGASEILNRRDQRIGSLPPVLIISNNDRDSSAHHADRNVTIVRPPSGLDWMELLRKHGTSALERCMTDHEIVPSGIKLAPPYIVRESGLWREDPALTQRANRLGGPIFVDAFCRDEMDSTWLHRILFRTIDREWRHLTISAAALRLRPRQVIASLLSAGYELAPHTEAEDHVIDHLRRSDVTRRLTITDRLGWHGRIYVAADRTFGNQDAVHRERLPGPAFAQSLPDISAWQREMLPLVQGNSRLLLSVCASLGAAAIGLLPEQNTFGIHLVGQSSTGKSTALGLAASLWADPTGQIKSWDMTSTGLEGLAEAHNHRLLVLDELAQSDPRQAAEAAYRLGNGRGRTRGNARGKAISASSWQTIFLSSGEITLAQKVAEWSRAPQRQDGEIVRIMDVPADAGQGHGLYECLHGNSDGACLSDRITRFYRSDFGAVAPTFIAALAEDPGAAQKLRTSQQSFLERYLPRETSGLIRRGYGNFAFLAAVGELARLYGLVPLADAEIMPTIATCAAQWLAQMQSEKVEPLDDFTRNLFALLQDLPDWNNALADAPGYRRNDRVYLKPDLWNELCLGSEPNLVAQALVKAGALRKTNGRYQSVHRHPVHSQPTRFYLLDLKAMRP